MSTGLILLYFILSLLILREREGVQENRGGTERERQKIPRKRHATSTESNTGLEIMNREIIT